MAVSVCVTNLGTFATNDLGSFAVARLMVFKLVAFEAVDKFGELLIFALWRGYFGVKGIQAFSDDCAGVFK